MEKLKQFFKKLKTIKNIEIIIGLVIIAALVLIYSSVSTKEKKTEEVDAEVGAELNSDLEERLASILSEIDGAGEVKVMITYAATAELVTAKEEVEHSTTTGGLTSSTTTTTATTSPIVSSGNVVIIQEKMPEIKGVIVVAEGADDVKVKLKLLSATGTILGVNANSIQIYTRRDV